MHDVESIEALQRCLVVYRRTLEFLELQRAQFGAFTPPYIWHQFDDTRSEIARVKHELREQGIEVADHPNDTAPASRMLAPNTAANDNNTLLTAYQRMLLAQVRYLSLAGMSDWHDQYRQLADLYVDRTLTPLNLPLGDEPGALAALPAVFFARSSAPAARLLIEGETGSGKTTCLHALALACTARALNVPGEAGGLAEAWPEPAPLPIVLSGRDIAAALTQHNAAPNDQAMPTLSAFWSAIESWLQYSNLQELVPTIQSLLEQGECIILIDDMDNLPPEASAHAFMAALGRFVARYPSNRFVVTCRAFQPNTMAPLASFTRYRLAPMDQGQISTFIRGWYAAVADRAGLLIAEDVGRRSEQLQALLLGDTRMRSLVRTPLTLALCVLVQAEGYQLPTNRDLVVRRMADMLLNGQRPDRHDSSRQLGQVLDAAQLSTPSKRLALLEPLALAFQSQSPPNNEQHPALRAHDTEELLRTALDTLQSQSITSTDAASMRLLEWCREQNLLVYAPNDTYSMTNVPLRQYLAGRALAALADFPTRAYERRSDQHWHETILYAIRELERRGAPHVARLFIRLLLHPPVSDQHTTVHDTLLAGECLLEMRERAWPDRALRAEVRERLLACVGQVELAIPERIKAGLLLGLLGDPRLANLLPPLAPVAGSIFVLGTTEGYDDEGPRQAVQVPAFSIGIYPVTNQEYARFLAENPQQPTPRHWHDPRYNNPSCPVVSVSWYDANAYCRWLTNRLQTEGILQPGQVVRLPREQEWEKASSWDAANQTKQVFPWGDIWSSKYANTAEDRGPWMTSPVGCYPESVSPYGLYDCVGNVWEWTASEYISYEGAERPFYEKGTYVLRGSSHATNPTHARCTYRSRLPPGSWRNHLGFRIVVVGEPADE